MLLDLFAGPGGWSEGMASLGLRAVGLELDADACRTRVAAGHMTVRTDVAAYPADAVGELGGLVASPPCFRGDTPVLTRRGVVPIADVRAGDLALTHRGRWRRVVRTGSKVAPVVSIKGQGTAELVATPDHPIWTRDYKRWRGGGRIWKEMWTEPEWAPAQRSAGRRWAMPTAVPSDTVEWPVDPWLVGRWLADGWADSDRGEVCWAIGDDKRQEFESRCSGAIASEQDGCARYTLYGVSEIARWLINGFGCGAADKTMPAWALGADEATRSALLDGYLAGDAHRIGPSAHKAVTVSRLLACGVRLLANSLGRDVSEVRNDPPPTKEMYDGRVVNQRPWYAITIRGPNPRRRYVHRRDGHAWMLVRSVEDAGDATVYDLEVEEDHSFVADGIVVHNCQAFSMAGKREGDEDLPRLHSAIASARDGWCDELRNGPWYDVRTPLILEPLRWAHHCRPTWIACEQVPPCLPIWEHMADVLRSWGYDAIALKLCSADYGVPQTRLRAFLLAHRGGVRVAEPTHAECPEPCLFGERLPWVSMAEALGWTPGSRAMDPRQSERAKARVVPDTEPSRTICSEKLVRGVDLWRLRHNNQERATIRGLDEPAATIFTGDAKNDIRWTRTRPATTVVRSCGQGKIAPPGHHDTSTYETDSVKVTLAEAAVLQGFRPDYPFQGSKTSRFRQVGNAVPPTWAAQIVGALTAAP